jgi:hypothetical protein
MDKQDAFPQAMHVPFPGGLDASHTWQVQLYAGDAARDGRGLDSGETREYWDAKCEMRGASQRQHSAPRDATNATPDPMMKNESFRESPLLGPPPAAARPLNMSPSTKIPVPGIDSRRMVTSRVLIPRRIVTPRPLMLR